MTVYVLVAVVKKRLSISADLYTILQVLSLTLFEKMSISKLFSDTGCNLSNVESHNQWILFEIIVGTLVKLVILGTLSILAAIIFNITSCTAIILGIQCITFGIPKT